MAKITRTKLHGALASENILLWISLYRLDIGLFLKFYRFGANSGKILCVSLTFGLLQSKIQRLNQFTRVCIIKNNYNGNAHFLVIKKKDQSLTRHQREIILMEIEWKKKFGRSLFSLDFNSQNQGY